VLVGLGLLEIRPMPFVSGEKGAVVRVTNPLAEDEPFLRATLLETLASRAEYNLARLQKSIRLFEIGTVFSAQPPGDSTKLPRENLRVGVVVEGLSAPRHFTDKEERLYDEWDAKWIAQVIAQSAFPASNIKLIPGVEQQLWEIHRDGKPVGHVERLALNAPVWAPPAFGIEVDLTDASSTPAEAAKHRPLPNTPPVEVDLALLVPSGVSAEQIESLIRAEAGDLLEDLALFDEFRGKGIAEGSRSLAWRLTFRSAERTLKEKEVQSRTAKIVRSLEEKLGVRQRTA
jgi:phenylalanyl-tRNA synthetase beta chain